ncbi:MAG: 50S ribosomal protein L29 [Candidatus Omnitrophota bacterium]
MKFKELIDLTKEELMQKRDNLKAELFKLNYQRKTGRVEKPHAFSLIKKDLARIETLLSRETKKENK